MTGMHQHDGYAPHSHEVRADHLGLRRRFRVDDMTNREEWAKADAYALDRITSLLGASQYHGEAVTLAEITAVVRNTGRGLCATSEPDNVACGQADET